MKNYVGVHVVGISINLIDRDGDGEVGQITVEDKDKGSVII